MKYIFNGEISQGYEWDELKIGNDFISDCCEDLDSKVVKLKYYISNCPIDKDMVVEQFLTSFYEGKCEVDATYCHGTSWTGIYSRNDDLKVGGHDIIQELQQHIGKYCHLEIELAYYI